MRLDEIKVDTLKGKYFIIVEYEKIIPEEGLIPDKEGCVSYKIDRDKVASIKKAKIVRVEGKTDPVDGYKTFRFYYECENKTGSVKYTYKEQLTEIQENTFIDSSLLKVKDQILELL